jgi:hypothetical protein
MDRNENPRSGRGQGTAVCSDGRDPITVSTRHDELGAAASASSHVGRVVSPPAQREFYELVAGSDEHTTTCDPCPRCGATVAVVGPGRGPYFASLRCLRGHHLGWLARKR